MKLALIPFDSLTTNEYLLLQHLENFNAPFYKSDVYLTFLRVMPNLTQFNKLFFQFRLRGYVYSLKDESPIREKQEPDSPETVFYKISARGIQQLLAHNAQLVSLRPSTEKNSPVL